MRRPSTALVWRQCRIGTFAARDLMQVPRCPLLAGGRCWLRFQPIDATPPFSRGRGFKPKAFL